MIRPTFLAFETAKRALNVSQAGLDTVGHNVSNANTPGYTRQRVDQISLSLNGSSQKYRTFGAAYTGQGADIKAISQIRDPYLDNRYRTEASVNGELGVKNYGLTDINNIFDETTTDGLHAKLSELLDRLDRLSQQADSKELATVVRTTAQQLASLLNKNSAQLEEARGQQTVELKTTVAENVNTILKEIANLNVSIKQDNFYGNPSNDLNDQRNLLIDNLSEFLDIKVVRTPVEVAKGITVENVNIYLNDGSDPPIALVESGFNNTLGVTQDEKGNVHISLIDGISGVVNKTVGKDGDITANLYKGALKGYIDIINGAGAGAPEGTSTYAGIPYYQAALDEFAQTLASVFNRINNITDGDIANNKSTSYDPTFEKNLFVSVSPTVTPNPATQTDWIGAFNTGTLGFSGSTQYDIKFTPDTNVPPSTITADVTINGQTQTYTAQYKAGEEMKFIGKDGTVAFSITGKENMTPTALDVKLDATITAKNITLSKNWMDDPLYMTATKKDASTIPGTTTTTVLSVDGNKPSWLGSVSDGEVQIANGNYEFYEDGDYLSLKDTNGNIYTSTLKLDEIKAGEPFALQDSSGKVGLYITPSSAPQIDADPAKNEVDLKNVSTSVAATVLTVSGTTPSWLKSVADGNDAVKIKDGSYEFKYDNATNPTKMYVDINGTEYSVPYSDIKAGARLALKDANGIVGLYVTMSSTPQLNSDTSKNVVNLKNETAAANDNILKFKEGMTSGNFYSKTGYTGSFQEFIVSFEGDMALQMSENESLLNTSTVMIGSYADRRDAVSAVSVDEEAINMMTYQNYYNAAARYMNVIDEALDKIINGMGMVGR